MSYKNTLKALFLFRDSTGKTQEELGAEIGLSRLTISRLENGAEPSGQTLKKIEAFLAQKQEPREIILHPDNIAVKTAISAPSVPAPVQNAIPARTLTSETLYTIECPECLQPTPIEFHGRRCLACCHCGATLGEECPKCGTINEFDAKYCKACGHPLTPEAKAQSDTDYLELDALEQTPAQTRRQRHVEILPSLRAWLDAFPPGKRIRVTNARSRIERLRTLAEIQDWPHDALRHTFATMHVAAFQDAPRTAHQLGHPSPNMLYTHYRGLTTSADGMAFFSLCP